MIAHLLPEWRARWVGRSILLRIATRLGFAAAIAVATGCMTIRTISSDRTEGEMYEDRSLAQSRPRMYSGVYDDASCIGHIPTEHGEGAGPIVVFCLLDLPLSIIADTLVVPYTLYEQIRFGNFHPRFVEFVHEEAERRRELRLLRRADFCNHVLEKSADGGSEVDERCRAFLRESEGTDAGQLPAPRPASPR
jgi:uncharacterized protein YceK